MPLITFIILILVGCAGAGNPSIPSQEVSGNIPIPTTDTSQTINQTGNHSLWSYNFIYVDPTSPGDIHLEVVPMRQVLEHWNTLSWLEQLPCNDCLQIAGIEPWIDGTLKVELEVTHPFTNPNLTGFDVRGIAMFNGNKYFPESGLTLPDGNKGDGELVDADGYTTLYNYSTVGSGPNGLQGYIQGKLASLAAPDALLNGYKRFVSEGTENARNAFYAGDSVIQTFIIDMPDGPFIFGYAIDGNWAQAETIPVTDPIADFGPDANCPEPWKIEVEEWGPGLTCLGGETSLSVYVYDWTGSESHYAPILECPGLFEGQKTTDWSQDTPDYTIYSIELDDVSADAGTFQCLISVEDQANGTAPEWLDLTAYQIFEIDVAWGWEISWGGSMEATTINDIATDSFGNAYVVGSFVDTVDFDPGVHMVPLSSAGGRDIYLAKYDASGNLIWVQGWGGPEDDEGLGVTVTSSDKVVITGYYSGTVDFNNDPLGDDEHTSNGFTDAFVCNLNEFVNSTGLTRGERQMEGITARILLISLRNISMYSVLFLAQWISIPVRVISN